MEHNHPMAEVLGKNIRIMLAENNMSAKDLSELSGITRPTLSKYVNGKSQAIHFETLVRLSDALGTTPTALLTEREEAPNRV